MNSEQAELMKRINDTGDYSDEVEAAFKASIEDFKKNHTW